RDRPWVRGEHAPQLAGCRLDIREALLPRGLAWLSSLGRPRRELHLRDDALLHGVEQLVLVGDVAVQRHRLDPTRATERAHRQRLDPLRVDQRDRSLDDALPGQALADHEKTICQPELTL